MFVRVDDTYINLDAVTHIVMVEGSRSLNFFTPSVTGGDHNLKCYIVPKGWTAKDVFKLIEEGLNSYKRMIELPRAKE